MKTGYVIMALTASDLQSCRIVGSFTWGDSDSPPPQVGEDRAVSYAKNCTQKTGITHVVLKVTHYVDMVDQDPLPSPPKVVRVREVK
jgi:hypothetical protein